MRTRSDLPATIVDTNILIYAYDQTDGAKRTQASNALDALSSGSIVLSTQVLNEFFGIVTRKIPQPLSLEQAASAVDNFISSWQVFGVTPLIVTEAIRGVLEHQLHYYDALLWATARLNQVTTILTEDGTHGRLIEGVRYVNPFHPDFEMAMVGL